ncbi:MAG: SDR family NAD(P)-dependent oxidoreductase [Acidimicrobiales bacterium]
MPPVTLITGARAGIGRSLAEHYAVLGHAVVGCSRNPVDWSLEGYEHHVADVADPDAVGRMFAEIRRRFGAIDHVVNNAGIASMNHALLTPSTTVERILSTNVAGTFLVAREAAKIMARRGWGRIVNLSTVAVPLRLAGEAAYVASKAAVVMLTQVLSKEFAPFGITVNAVGPGPMRTHLTEGVPEPKLEQLLDQQAIHRFATVSDVVNVVDFFLRRESDFVTGQTVYLGGVA